MKTDGLFRRFGDKISVNGRQGSGILLPMHPKDPEINKRPLPSGVVNGESYLLMTAMPLSEGDTVSCCGHSYEVRCSAQVRLMGDVSHYEGVLRLAGRA